MPSSWEVTLFLWSVEAEKFLCKPRVKSSPVKNLDLHLTLANLSAMIDQFLFSRISCK